MTNRPKYFDEIREKAANRWGQLEKDPELAAPWHQLFKQVQSPRHVLSELLQNADDAEATKVAVEIDNGYFSFTHNGKDFTQDDFGSLCRFGYSNKRLLRTIGFRGIGFKSTFSLGQVVELRTPTLTVGFKKGRFTEPFWLDGKTTKNGITNVRVKIQDVQRQKELENNIAEWLSSPFSLLFFNHIRQLKLDTQELHWKSRGSGPATGTEIMQLQGAHESHLVIRSKSETFPKEALQEIHEERLLDTSENVELPPCKVEIVLGAPGKLFVVLPTGVRTQLPFAINAPFIQDPARLKIKDPEISFTNRWLLQRAGELIAETMLQWLNHKKLSMAERASAYDLLPKFAEENASLESICESAVENSLSKSLNQKPFILTEDGSLELTGRSVSVPAVFWKIWNAEQILSVISGIFRNRSLLSNSVSDENQNKLLASRALLSVKEEDIQNLLVAHKLPAPSSRTALLELWSFANQWKYSWKNKNMNIYPVKGQDVLYSASEIVRLGEKKLLQSEDDWEFLSRYLLVMDANWLRYLTEQKRLSEKKSNEVFEKILAAEQLLSSTGLDKPSDTNVVMAKVAKDFFEQKNPPLNESIRLTQIAAKLNAKIGVEFKLWTMDERLRSSDHVIIFDTGSLEEMIPPELLQGSMLHPNYSRRHISCTKDEWVTWIQSENTWVRTFVPIVEQTNNVYGKARLERELQSRGYDGMPNFWYKNENFLFEDLDFPNEYWKYWTKCAQSDPAFWSQLMEQLLKNPKAWERSMNAIAYQVATTNSRKAMSTGRLPAAWVLKFRQVSCLCDTHGQARLPAELMCRTPETEPHMGMEPFVNAKLDKFEARELLIQLGVRTIPSGPKQILERLQALSKIAKPPLSELINIYERLDKSFENSSTVDQQEIRKILRDDALIFSEDGAWQTADSIYVTADESDAPGAALIHPLANQLALWRKVGVNERPTAELAIQWLMKLPVGEKLPNADVTRIRALLGRHPLRVWNECGHWLNLSSEWVAVNRLHYAVTMQSLFQYGNFHEWVKAETANFQMLGMDFSRQAPFSELPTLASQIERRLEKPARKGGSVDIRWLNFLGRLLTRVKLDDEVLTGKFHQQAERLINTSGIGVETILTLPYLNGKPAGLEENMPIAWVEQTLYFTRLSDAKRARLISEIIAKAFDWSEMQAILSYCYERSDVAIRSYMEENFVLEAEESVVSNKDKSKEQTKSVEGPDPVGKIPEISPDQNQTQGENKNTPLSPVEVGDEEPEKAPRELHTRTQPPKLPLIQRFANGQGFQEDGLHQFRHRNGSVLIKSNGLFPWLMQDKNGTVLCYFWPKEHCLDIKPLEIPTEIWHQIEQTPKQHALLLEDRDGNPIQMPGKDLLTSKQHGKLKLYPAAYRLTLEIDN